ncbi:hypothetical protein BFP77_09515 [Maribacter sp. 4U21]|nr:hypothetical protein BFP77_09515 [Maribacter sp. 4U21]
MGRIFLTVIGYITRLFTGDLKNNSKKDTLIDFQENINIALLLLARIGILIIIGIVIVKIIQSIA